MNDQIEEILNRYDFTKVYEVMESLDWKWASLPTYRIPTVDDMRKCARELLYLVEQALNEHNDYSAATGGFEASGWKNDEGVRELELKFIVESKSARNHYG